MSGRNQILHHCLIDIEFKLRTGEKPHSRLNELLVRWWQRKHGFYSSTEVYCAPRKAGTSTTNMMWTAEDVKGVLNQLGAGWGLCQPSQTNCIEPGKTGPSSGWCGWYPPMSTGTGTAWPMPAMTSPLASGTRTCPGFDGTVPTPEPKPEPKPLPVPLPEPVNCPKDPITSMMCQPGSVIVKGTMPNGCPMSYCKPEKEPFPKPFPEPQPEPWPVPGPYPMPYPVPKIDNCQMLRENVRPYKYEVRRIVRIFVSYQREQKFRKNSRPSSQAQKQTTPRSTNCSPA